MEAPGAGAAFVAGLASFLSPCVLPLVPGYISMLSGLSLEQLSEGADRRSAAAKAAAGSVFFVLGFSAVFTALGASASAVGGLLAAHRVAFSRLAGAAIIIFGLHLSELLPIRLLYYERRLALPRSAPGLMGAFVMGLAFAFGWTPCIGPILAGVLALASTQDTVGQGIFLLAVYSLGLGIPFILTGLGINAFLRFFKAYKPFLRWGERLAGALLIIVGVLVMTNKLTRLISWLPAGLFRFAL